MTRSATLERRPTLRLVIPRADAVLHITKLLEDGQSIRTQRIRSSSTLDSARELKAEWSGRALDLLKQMFGDPAIAEETMAWVGKILPEYSHLGAFVESFHDEMDHHLKNLTALKKLIERKPSPSVREAVIAPSTREIAPPPSIAEAVAAAEADEEQANAEAAALPVIPPPPLPARPLSPLTTQTSHASNSRPTAPAKRPAQPAVAASKGMLILHGDGSAASASLRDFVQTLGLVLICAQAGAVADDHQTAIAALEGHDDFNFALVLIDSPEGPTPDDVEPASLGFELGYCVGRLGLGRVCALHPRATEPYTDSHGILHLPLDPTGGWQLQLARHFKRSGINLDLNKLC